VYKVSLVDLPNVVANIKIDDPKLNVLAGSFFDKIHLSADIFILKRILHDWDDEKSLSILKNIRQAMLKNSNSRLIIFEGILDYSDKASILPSVDLALLTIFGGEERCLQDFEKLLTAAGFSLCSVTKVTQSVSALECSVN